MNILSETAVQEAYTRRFPELLADKTDEGYAHWYEEYVGGLRKFKGADKAQLSSKELQQILWEENPCASVGQGKFDFTKALADKDFRDAVASQLTRKLSPAGPERLKELGAVREALLGICMKQLRTERTPRAMVTRALAIVFPQDFTCVVDERKMRCLARAVLGPELQKGETDPVRLHALVIEWLSTALGPSTGSVEDLVKRSIFSWHLYTLAQTADEEAGTKEGTRPGEEKLVRLPAAMRLRGIPAINGYAETVLQVIEYARNGVTVDDLKQFIQDQFPHLKKVSAGHYVSTIRSYFGVLKQNGESITLTPLGEECLNSEDPKAILRARLISRITGFDCLLTALKHQPATRADLFKAMRAYYPRWTTDFAPSSVLAWAVSLELVAVDSDKKLRLTEVGRYWAEQLPDKLEPIVDSTPPIPEPDVTEVSEPAESEGSEFEPPTLAGILKKFGELPYVFPAKIVVQLHLALHSHPRKHFVLLSGLSGTGKTKLAEVYANVYHGITTTVKNPYYCLVPVQPDWVDSTGLLGYVNPLQTDVSYEQTTCLEFLHHAHEHPRRPHFLCLDEMNLARVEYYFAPFLSAMETGQPLVIHHNKDLIDGVEPSIAWPDNLFIVGTVNMDETTYAFSDKVLDRAFTLAFWDVDFEEFRKRFAANEENAGYPGALLDSVLDVLKEAKAALEPVRLHFGYRTAEEILLFMRAHADNKPDTMTRTEALDSAICMKVLTKIRGQDTPEMRKCLDSLISFSGAKGLAACKEKLESMRQELGTLGTTQFWR